MLELGRPTHVFDLDRIRDGLDVRWGQAGETLELLNGQTVTIDAEVGVIASGGRPESLAGIMGGEASAVTDDTRDVFLEAAFWWPAAIAGRSRRFNFSTDASARFERGVDAASTVEHLEYLTRLVLDICGGAAGPVDDLVTGLPERTPVRMRATRARKILGVEIADDEMAAIFQRLRLPFERDADVFTVQPPSFRFDLQIEEDLIEEVARIWGYERLPVRAPRGSLQMQAVPETTRSVSRLARNVAARDYQEVITWSFVDSVLDGQLGAPGPIRLLNPIAAGMDVLRTTLWGGLMQTLRTNLARKASRVRLFEIGRVFLSAPAADTGTADPVAGVVAGIFQPARLALMAYGPRHAEQWALGDRLVDFYDLRGDLETVIDATLRFEAAEHLALHPGRSARVLQAGQPVGWIGELHPQWQQAFELPSAPVLAEIDLPVALARRLPVLEESSRFPPVIRDLALVVDADLAVAKIFDEIERVRAEEPAAAIIQTVRLFDEYRGKGLENKEKSLAFRLWIQDTRRTLSEAEATAAVDAVVARLAHSLGARLRTGGETHRS